MNLKLKVKAVYFDAAHTTLRLARPYPDMIACGLAQHGFSAPADKISHSLVKCWEQVEYMFNGVHDGYKVDDEWDRSMWFMFYRLMMADMDITGYPEQMLSDIYAQFRMPENWELYPEVLGCMAQLKARGYKVGIGSNWDSSLPRIIESLGITPLLDVSVVSCVIGWRKPGADFFRAECEMLGLQADEVLHVGDHPVADAQGALQAGLSAVLVWRSPKPYAGPPVTVIQDLSELPGILA